MRILSITALLTLTAPASAESLRHAGNFGLGLGGGTYGGGLSAKYWASETMALQGTLNADGNEKRTWVALSGDYLFEFPVFANPEGLEIAWNLGPGAGVQLTTTNPGGGTSDNDVGLAFSAVGGLEFDLTVIPLDVVLEARPLMITLVPGDAGFDLELVNLGGHIRYYFR